MPEAGPSDHSDEAFCYLTTTGRRTGRPTADDLVAWARTALPVAIEALQPRAPV